MTGQEISLDGYSVVRKECKQGIKAITLLSKTRQVSIGKALFGDLRLAQKDRVNVFINRNKKSIIIEFAPDGLFKINASYAISSSRIFKEIAAAGIHISGKKVYEKFNLDYVNKRIEFLL
jgi:hypothetical protein